jgi:Protein of unknown function (DUF3987)
MASRHFPDWLQAFVKFASYGEAPTKMYFWTGVSTIAGALRRRVWIDQKYFQWVPNNYIILVAPPGIVSKSTTASIGMSILKEVPGVNFGPDVVTWQKLVEDMAKSAEMVYWPEKEVYLPMSCVTISSSEFGTLLDPNNREMVDVLVSLWDGQPGAFKKATKTSGSDSIENPWINIIACTTPSWIAGNFPEYMIGGGFTSRCLFIYADKKRQLVPYPADFVPPDFAETRAHLIADLERISTLVGEYHLSPEAKTWGTTWYENHYKTKHEHLSPEQFGGYLARKQTHIHKLAMILTAARSDELLILPETLEFSSKLIDALEDDMPKVFGKIGLNPKTKALSDICEIVAVEYKLSRKDLYRRLSRQVTWAEFGPLLQSAVEAGFIRLVQEGAEVYVIAGGAKGG